MRCDVFFLVMLFSPESGLALRTRLRVGQASFAETLISPHEIKGHLIEYLHCCMALTSAAMDVDQDTLHWVREGGLNGLLQYHQYCKNCKPVILQYHDSNL